MDLGGAMHILFACIEFESLTGMPMYIYELSRRYIQLGHTVTILANNVGGEITARAITNGVNVYAFRDISDGLFPEPDILHLNEYEPSYTAILRWPHTPAVATVHSQYPCEQPLNHSNIKRYICIRPEIIDHIKRLDRIPVGKIRFIPNGIDFIRFNSNVMLLKYPEVDSKKLVIFIGTIDELRKQSILHLMANAITQDFRVIFIGKKHATYLDGELHKNIAWVDDTWNVEDYIMFADETAGILLGRTTIESWACGIPSWIYDIDLEGNIKSVKLYPPPKDINKYNIVNVADRIIELYGEVM